MMVTVNHSGHMIQVEPMGFLGKETVYYDGRVVSEKTSLTGANHDFSVAEDGEQIFYQVNISASVASFLGAGPNVEIRRNGQVIYSQRS
jgi:hypothetical protein